MSRTGRRRSGAVLVACWALISCSELPDNGLEPGPAEERAIVLSSLGKSLRVWDLDARGLPAFSGVVPLPDNFDGVTFDIRGTLALTTASEVKGSWVFITNLVPEGTTHPLDLPDAADPAAVRYLSPDTAFVAGRGNGILYRLTLADSTLTEFTGDVAQSPYDLLPFGGRLYVVDANQDRSDFSTLGPSQVVTVDLATGLAVDTLPLTGFGAVAGALVGSKLFVLESGSFPDPQAKLAVVELSGGLPSLVTELDLGVFGLSLESAADGRLYVSVVPDLADFDTKVIVVVDPVTNEFVYGPTDPLPLKRPDGSNASCYAASASADGKIFCIEARPAERGLLYVYGPDLQGLSILTVDELPTDLLVVDFP